MIAATLFYAGNRCAPKSALDHPVDQNALIRTSNTSHSVTQETPLDHRHEPSQTKSRLENYNKVKNRSETDSPIRGRRPPIESRRGPVLRDELLQSLPRLKPITSVLTRDLGVPGCYVGAFIHEGDRRRRYEVVMFVSTGNGIAMAAQSTCGFCLAEVT